MESTMVLIAVLAYIGLAFVWPTIRVWRRHGTWPVVFSREAAPAQRVLGWLTRLLVVVVVGTSLARIFLDPGQLGIWRAPLAVDVFGAALLVIGAVLTVVAQRQMGASWRIGIDDRPTQLLSDGVFRLVRNPIFTGLLVSLLGYVCLMPAWWSLALWVATAVGLRIQIGYEERHLMQLHGDVYLEYASRVGRFVPLLGRLHD